MGNTRRMKRRIQRPAQVAGMKATIALQRQQLREAGNVIDSQSSILQAFNSGAIRIGTPQEQETLADPEE